jgi:hypothetical protein
VASYSRSQVRLLPTGATLNEAFADQVALAERDLPTRGVGWCVSKAFTRSTSASRPLKPWTTSYLDVAQDARPVGSVTDDVDQLRLETAGGDQQAGRRLHPPVARRWDDSRHTSHAHGTLSGEAFADRWSEAFVDRGRGFCRPTGAWLAERSLEGEAFADRIAPTGDAACSGPRPVSSTFYRSAIASKRSTDRSVPILRLPQVPGGGPPRR